MPPRFRRKKSSLYTDAEWRALEHLAAHPEESRVVLLPRDVHQTLDDGVLVGLGAEPLANDLSGALGEARRRVNALPGDIPWIYALTDPVGRDFIDLHVRPSRPAGL